MPHGGRKEGRKAEESEEDTKSCVYAAEDLNSQGQTIITGTTALSHINKLLWTDRRKRKEKERKKGQTEGMKEGRKEM